MTDRFQRYFDWLIPWEGEDYENDPDDRGGGTKFGIDSASHPGVDIRNLTRDQAREIYWNQYWNAVHAEELPPGVGEVLTDIAVNNGRGRGIKWLQQIVGTDPDGVIGPKTLAAVHAMDPQHLTALLLGQREAFYEEIAHGTQYKFLAGRLNRNKSLTEFVTHNPPP